MKIFVIILAVIAQTVFFYGLAAAQPVLPAALQGMPPEVQKSIQEAVQKGTISAGDLSQAEKLLQKDSGLQTPVGSSAPADLPAGTPAPAPSKNLAKIEQQYRNGYASMLTADLHQFGYDIFQSSAAGPSNLAIPDHDYILGPGDKLRIRLWGTDVDAEFSGAVARDGTINVPKIGIVPLAGLPFGKVEAVVRREAEKYVQGINVNVALEELRSVEVYVVGAVSSPGLHMLPAFSTVLGSLLAGGGVQKTGSLRNIELYRDGRLHRKVDLYDLLLKGDRDADIILADRDVIFVPRLGKTAAVVGAVSEEAIFELSGENTVGALLDLAGNILPQGFTGRIYLRRYTNNRDFVVQDIDTSLDRNGSWRGVSVQDGDLLELQFLLSAWPEVVKLEGHVWRPDVFQYTPGLTLAKVLVSPDLLKPGSVTDFALLHRYDQATTRFQVRRFPLADVLAGSYDTELRPYDRIEILSRQALGITEEFSIHGAVWNSGIFPYRPGLTVADALALAGGEKFGARLQRIEISRQEIENDKIITRQIVVDLEKDGAFPLQPYDSIFLQQLKDATLQQKITLTGEVRYPGTYVIQGGDRLSDVIQRAGGFLPEAYFFGAEYTSEKARRIQQESIERLLQELEIKIRQITVGEAQTAAETKDIESAKAAEASFQTLMNKLRAVRASGRVSIVLSDLESFRGSKFDFQIENGDAMHIPKRPNFIATIGSVYSPSAYLYEPNLSLQKYLDKSGGPTKSADEKYIYLLRANGEVISKASRKGLFTSFDSITLMPGDTIVVPENLERVPYLRLVRDISDIVFKIATTAGVAVAVL